MRPRVRGPCLAFFGMHRNPWNKQKYAKGAVKKKSSPKLSNSIVSVIVPDFDKSAELTEENILLGKCALKHVVDRCRACR